jgi:glycosyltransferase involved in cell wall biosynthesis
MAKKLQKANRLNVAIFNWRDPWNPKAGGAEQVTLEHAKAWVKEGHTVTWIAGKYAGSLPKEKKEGVRFYRFGSAQTLFLRAGWIYWLSFFAQFDIVIDEVHGLPNFSAIWSGRAKKIAFIHEVAQEIWDEMFPFPINIFGKFVERTVFPLTYRNTPFWVDCESTKKDLVELGIPGDHINIIPCAIHPYPQQRIGKQKNMTLIFLARLVKMKGIETAIEVFKEVLKQEPSARLWIVGRGEESYVQELKKHVEELGMDKHVKFWGGVSEKQKYQLLARAHFLLHTSVREGFGLTILEAASQKTPALVFNVAALRDIVQNNETGFITPIGHLEELAQTAVMVYRDKKLYKKIAQQALEFSQKFRWSVFTKQSSELIEAVADVQRNIY